MKNVKTCQTKVVVAPSISDLDLQRRKQSEIIKLFGKIDYDSDYDYKQSRRKQQQEKT